jgi:hypothetical protein
MTLPYADQTDDQLLNHYLGLSDALAYARGEMEEIRRELHQRMVSTNATEISHAKLECKLERNTAWDKDRLKPLLDGMLPEDVLSLGYTPPREEVILREEVWDMRVVPAWVKYGGTVRDLIEAARTEYVSGLTIKAKGAKGAKGTAR